MSIEAETVILDGLKRALIEATGNLYRVFTSVDRGPDHEDKFVKGIAKHMKDYDRMAELLMGQKKA